MGTNYYAVKKISQCEKKEMAEMIENERYKELIEKLSSLTREIHIGKRSCGWAFLFQANGDSVTVPWNNLKELKEYLQRNDVQIKNEYGETFSPEQFWDEEVGDTLHPNKDNLCEESYSKKHVVKTRMPSNEYIADDVRWCNVDFS